MLQDFDQSFGTTWNPTDNSDALLSNGNLTALFGASVNVFHSIRSNSSKTSGKFMFVTQMDKVDSVGGWVIGVGSLFESLFVKPGDTPLSVGALFGAPINNLYIYANQFKSLNLTSRMRNHIATCVDVDNKLVWWNNLDQGFGWTNISTGDFSGDPTQGIGGTEFSFDTSLGLFIIGSGYNYLNEGDSLILNPQCFGYTDFIPDEFQSWDLLTKGFTVAEQC